MWGELAPARSWWVRTSVGRASLQAVVTCMYTRVHCQVHTPLEGAVQDRVQCRWCSAGTTPTDWSLPPGVDVGAADKVLGAGKAPAATPHWQQLT